MKANKGPEYVLRDSQGIPQTDLLSRVLKQGEQVLKAEGIDLDEGKKDEASTSWEGVNAIADSVRNGIMKAAITIDTAWTELKEYDFPNKEEVQLQVDTTNNDLEQLSDKWQAIQKRHKENFGPVADGNDLAISLGCTSDYTMLSEQVKSTIFGTMLSLTEAGAAAIRIRDGLPAEQTATTEETK